MRRDAIRGVMAVVVLAATMVACGGNKNAEQDTGTAAAPKTMTVKMRVVCGDSTYVAVDPWEVHVNKRNRDDIDFVLDDSSSVDSVEVALKAPGDKWPLQGNPPFGVKKGSNTKKGQEPTVAKGQYAYNIIANCTVGTSARKLVIDPDIFVD